jgi:hypothetical protein
VWCAQAASLARELSKPLFITLPEDTWNHNHYPASRVSPSDDIFLFLVVFCYCLKMTFLGRIEVVVVKSRHVQFSGIGVTKLHGQIYDGRSALMKEKCPRDKVLFANSFIPQVTSLKGQIEVTDHPFSSKALASHHH